ncbi:hypothetical protein V0288_03390 [Pannus brasiliensis CCIBt3594]|uniref:Uncharacterized protein n=1 Tax=Pannus brasiliensis CCIBt3594 TaxID=1427578 RepID=A0AAW9QPJ8_9CHRO
MLPVNFHESRKPNVTESDRDWLDSDISRLEEYESYDRGEIDPLTLGKPVKYIPNVGLVVEGGKENV